VAEAEGEGGPAQAGLGGDQQQERAQAEAEGEQRQGGRAERQLAVGAEQGLAADQEQGEGGPPGAALGEGEKEATVALEAGGGLFGEAAQQVVEAVEDAQGQAADGGEAAAEQVEQRPQVGEAAQAGAQAPAGGEGAAAGERGELAAERGGPGGELAAEFTGARGDLLAEGAEARLPGAIRFFLSTASAFVTGQPLRITKLAKGDRDTGNFVKPLNGKVVMVTGAARGIGAATAEILANEGAHVVVLDRPADDQPASEVARKIGGTVLLADVSDPKAPEQIASFLKEKFGGVDVVIHNAGITRDKMFANMKPDVWDATIDINLAAVVRITDALLSGDVLREGGRIICLSSIAGLSGNAGQTNYAASKGGIAGYVRNLATKTAAKGITVNAIAPGFIETRMTAAIPVAIREVARRLSALGQGGQPSDVGQAITFLSTPGAQGVSGQVLRVCGGAFVGA